MESTQVNDVFIPKDQCASTVSLIQSVKQNIEIEKGLKPWWYFQLDELSGALNRLKQNQGVKIGDFSTQDEIKAMLHPRDVGEAIKGVMSGKMEYHAWTQSCFVQFGSKKLPTNKDEAADQLRVNSWWIGNNQGVSEEMTKGLLAISKLYTEDFPQQANVKFSNDPEKKQFNMKKLVDFGRQLFGWDKETTSIEFQKVYWDVSERKPIFMPIFTIRISKTLDEKCKFTIFGTDPYRSEDKRTYYFENPSDGENIIKEIEKSIDLISKQQNKYRKN